MSSYTIHGIEWLARGTTELSACVEGRWFLARKGRSGWRITEHDCDINVAPAKPLFVSQNCFTRMFLTRSAKGMIAGTEPVFTHEEWRAAWEAGGPPARTVARDPLAAYVVPAAKRRVRMTTCPHCGYEQRRGRMPDQDIHVQTCEHCYVVFEPPLGRLVEA